jgi:hypothetical protein
MSMRRRGYTSYNLGPRSLLQFCDKQSPEPPG